MTDALPAPHAAPSLLLVRGQQVILDAAVAHGFGVETKRVNEAVSRNPHKFDARHVFTLTPEETQALRSRAATSNVGRGGARYLPNVFTAKGVARLATILDTEQALLATDLIIDTFLEVQRQVAAGETRIEVSKPAKLKVGRMDALRAQLERAVDALLDTVIDTANARTAREVGGELSARALENLRERLRTKGLENTKLEAEAIKIMAEAEKLYAEARKTHAEADGVALDNIPRRIRAVRELIELQHETEAPSIVQLLTVVEQGEPLRIGAPGAEPDGAKGLEAGEH